MENTTQNTTQVTQETIRFVTGTLLEKSTDHLDKYEADVKQNGHLHAVEWHGEEMVKEQEMNSFKARLRGYFLRCMEETSEKTLDDFFDNAVGLRDSMAQQSLQYVPDSASSRFARAVALAQHETLQTKIRVLTHVLDALEEALDRKAPLVQLRPWMYM